MVTRRPLLLGTLAAPFVIGEARAADTVKVAIFEAASTLPYFVALTRGFFTEAGIAPQGFALATHPLIVQALVAGDAEACTNLVTLEGANINVRRPNTVLYFTMNGQNARHQMEQFVVRSNSTATRLADLRGARILSAPGPANMAAARGVLAAVGLQEGRDYTLVEQPMGMHIGAMQSGQFDAAYTLEPVATIGERAGAMKRLEAGVIATYLLGRRDAQAYAGGAGFSGRFLEGRRDVANRFAQAWARAIEAIRTDPTTRQVLTSNLNTPADLAAVMPLQAFTMIRDFTAQDRADLQKFVDIGVQMGVVRGAIDVGTFIRPL
ncbi:ABC transporter substrate-binding protein [Neoroseomonas rubea]|uniref:ABC transporter substrate-binding protein n=1 Tax=Neoroseomonas rubea TaxID=2748666 RepID=UPI0018E053E7|nr:ABC transporter substrate-binding protein [Roseomonas rubea]